MTMHKNLPAGFAGGLRSWRLVVLHVIAKALGLLVHVEGFPYGTRRNIEPRLATSIWLDGWTDLKEARFQREG